MSDDLVKDSNSKSWDSISIDSPLEYDIRLFLGSSTPLDAAFEKKFARNAHIRFILGLDDKTDTFEFYAMEHLRMSGVYWGIMAIDLLGGLHLMNEKKIIDFVLACYDPVTGGFSGNIHHDPHLLYTLSALQILAIYDSMHLVDIEKVTSYVKALQRPDGSFMGDRWGEVDTRFSYCALNALSLMQKLQENEELVKNTVSFIGKCRNFDGGFGAVPGAESHAGQIFCCVAALAIANKVEEFVDRDVLGWLLCERQLKCGGYVGSFVSLCNRMQ